MAIPEVCEACVAALVVAVPLIAKVVSIFVSSKKPGMKIIDALALNGLGHARDDGVVEGPLRRRFNPAVQGGRLKKQG